MAADTAAALATAAIVPAVFGAFLPPLSDVRAAHPYDEDTVAGVQTAAVVAAALVATAGIATHDRHVIAFGCATALAFACIYTHARWVG